MGNRGLAGGGSQAALLPAAPHFVNRGLPDRPGGDHGPGAADRLRLRPLFSKTGGSGGRPGGPGPFGLGRGALLVGSESSEQ